MRTILYWIPLFLLSYVQFKSTFASDPCADGTYSEGELFLHEEGCHPYYNECVHGKSLQRPCATGTVFDASIGVCNHPRDVSGCGATTSQATMTEEPPKPKDDRCCMMTCVNVTSKIQCENIIRRSTERALTLTSSDGTSESTNDTDYATLMQKVEQLTNDNEILNETLQNQQQVLDALSAKVKKLSNSTICSSSCTAVTTVGMEAVTTIGNDLMTTTGGDDETTTIANNVITTVGSKVETMALVETTTKAAMTTDNDAVTTAATTTESSSSGDSDFITTAPPDCYETSDHGASYRGSVSTTVSGKTCQPWASQLAHSYGITAANYPSSGLTSNYCRNPGAYIEPWCFIIDLNADWEPCTVEVCKTAN